MTEPTVGDSEAFAIDVVDLPDGVNEDTYNEKADKFLKEQFKHMHDGQKEGKTTAVGAGFLWTPANKVALSPEEKLALKAVSARIKEIKSELLAEQQEYVTSVKKRAGAMLKGLDKHIKVLSSNLKQKMAEFNDSEKNRNGKFRNLHRLRSAQLRQEEGGSMATSETSVAAETLNTIKRWFWMAEDEPAVGESENLQGNIFLADKLHKAEQDLLQDIRQMSEELELARNEKWAVEVERFFPKRMRWKLRINAGDGSCLGFQDLDFDSIVGNATLKMGEERGVISLQIRDIAASIGISNFSVKGATVRSQVTKMVLTPTVNRLDFHLAGDWTLVLKYEPATEQNNYQAKWVEDKQRSTLESLRLNREMSGLSALRLPKKIIEYLATSLIPSAINESVKNSFSPSLGNTLLEKSHNKIVLEGKIKIEQDINSKVWRAPFVGNTMSAKMARESLHLSDEEATWLDLLLRGKLATDAGFRRKTSSMYRLHKWRLLYAAQPVSRLKEICQLIQQDSSVYGFGQPKDENLDGRQSFADSKENSTDKVPEDWLFQIIDSVEDFADKEVKCKLELYKIDFDLDLTNVVRFFADSHLISLEEQALNAKSQNAKRAATKRKVATEQRIKNAQVWFSNTVMPLLTRNYYANVNGYLQGGLDAGSLGLTLQDFSGGVFMNNFSYDALLGWSPSKLSGWNLNIQGDQDQTNSNETAYSIRFKHKFMDKEDELYDRDHSDEDARVTMKDVDLKLFPRGYDPGR